VRVFLDTEEVRGSNPLAPTRKLLVNGTYGYLAGVARTTSIAARWICVVILPLRLLSQMRSMLGYAAVASAGFADPRNRRNPCRMSRKPLSLPAGSLRRGSLRATHVNLGVPTSLLDKDLQPFSLLSIFRGEDSLARVARRPSRPGSGVADLFHHDALNILWMRPSCTNDDHVRGVWTGNSHGLSRCGRKALLVPCRG
jgi:hypothetical protein